MTKNIPPSPGSPDLESPVRFGCGFMIGLFVPFLWGFLWEVTTIGWGIMAVCVISALIFGFLSIRYGDRESGAEHFRFWRMLVKFWNFWW
jgi:hypothetical protein